MKRYNYFFLLISVLVLEQSSYADFPRNKQPHIAQGLLVTGLGLWGVYSGCKGTHNQYALAKNWNQEHELAKQKEAEKNAHSFIAILKAYRQGVLVHSGVGQYHHYLNAICGGISIILSGAMTAYGINNIGKALRK